MQHGRDLLKAMLTQFVMPRAMEVSGKKPSKRVRSDCLQFIEISAPPTAEQVVHLRDVDVDEASHWRGGLNRSPTELSKKMVIAIQRELELFDLSLAMSDNVMSLFTRKARGEGDMLCVLSGLLFDSIGKLHEFVCQDDHKPLMSHMVKVSGVACEQGSETIYVILTGVGTFLRHFLSKPGKKKPNTTHQRHVKCVTLSMCSTASYD